MFDSSACDNTRRARSDAPNQPKNLSYRRVGERFFILRCAHGTEYEAESQLCPTLKLTGGQSGGDSAGSALSGFRWIQLNPIQIGRAAFDHPFQMIRTG